MIDPESPPNPRWGCNARFPCRVPKINTAPTAEGNQNDEAAFFLFADSVALVVAVWRSGWMNGQFAP